MGSGARERGSQRCACCTPSRKSESVVHQRHHRWLNKPMEDGQRWRSVRAAWAADGSSSPVHLNWYCAIVYGLGYFRDSGLGLRGVGLK